MSSWMNSRILYITVAIAAALFAYIYQSLRANDGSSRVVLHDQQRDISYVGETSSGIEKYQSIFYAQDTAGSRRFAPPVAFVSLSGSLVDATSVGAACPQGVGPAALPFTSPVTNISENCLSLGITRPAGVNASARLPVIVWMHGGGFTLGTGYDQLYQPDGLVEQSTANGQPIIFVAINYRIAIFGFAVTGALRDAKSLNVGLLDQRAAFEWVRENIEAFGGDPHRVTAMGQSVGANSIGLHLVSHGGTIGVPFQKGVMMSGASGLNFNIDSDLVANNTAAVAKELDCVRGDVNTEATLACLRETPLERLTNVSVSLARQQRPPFGELSFYPSLDGHYLPERPSLLLQKGHFVKDIPLIAAWTANDGAWYPPPSTDSDEGVLASFSTFIVRLTENTLQRLLTLYPLSDFQSQVQPGDTVTAQYYRAARINRDLWFTCPVVDFTWQYHKHGSTNVRMYEMNQTRFQPVWDVIGVPFWRVGHLSDIPYMLNGEVAGGGDNSPGQRELAKRMSGSVAAFAYTGDPMPVKGIGLRDWPKAYQGVGGEALAKDYPEKAIIHVMGGPHGSGPALVDITGHGRSSKRALALQDEKILERCRFINSVREEIGV